MEDARATWGSTMLDRLGQDLKYALRQMRRSPGFTCAAVVSLALGIGANTAVFSLVDRALIRPLPVADPENLMLVSRQRPDGVSTSFSFPFYTTLRNSSSGVFSALIARAATPVNAIANGQVIRIQSELVSGNYFDALGVKPVIGRTFLDEENRTPGTHPVVVLSYRFWQRTFARAPDVAGATIQINNSIFTVIGVAAAGFTGTNLGSPVDVWAPMMMQVQIGKDHLADRSNWLEVIGRLQKDVTKQQAEAVISLEASGYADKADTPQRISLTTLENGNSRIRGEIGAAFTLLMVITWLAILLACSNVGNLLLARATARAKEISVRMALGAGRERLARQFIIESLVLSLFGGAAALAVSPWAAQLLVALQPERLAGVDASLDLRIFTYALVTSCTAGLVLGLAPIFAARRIGVANIWTGARWAPDSRTGRFRLRDGLVIAQITMSVVMLIGAGLLLQSLGSLRSVNPGFPIDNLLLVSLDPAAAGYGGASLRTFWEESLERMRALPGVQSATLAGVAPMGTRRQRQPVSPEVFNSPSDELEIDSNFVGPDYFRTLEIPIVRGRDFDRSDRMDSSHVVIVNEAVARLLWPAENPVGKRMRVGGSASRLLEVVAVVKDAKYQDLRDDPSPMVYRPLQQTGSSDLMTLHIRVPDPNSLAELVREEIRIMDSDIPVFQVTTLEERIDSAFGATRQAAALSGSFGVLALILSAVGVYGLTAFAVSAQTREIGIRLAVGASSSQIAKLIARRGLWLLAAGLTLGLLCAFMLTRIFESLLFGVESNDAATFVGAAALLALVSGAAMYLPVRKATRLDPVVALRRE